MRGRSVSRSKSRTRADETGGESDPGSLDLRHLRHFLAVVDHGNFGQAALQLGLTKQALSQSVAALEESLGVRLFERGQFGAVVTEFGRLLTQHARLIQAEVRKTRSEIDSLRAEHRGVVTFALGSSFSEFIAPAAIRRFQAAHPRVVLKIANVHPNNMLQLLAEGELDFVAMGELRNEGHAGLERRALFRMRNQPIMASSHPLASKRRLHLEDLAGQTFVGVWRDDLAERTLTRAFESRGLSTPRMIECDNALVTRGLVLDEGCIVIANRLFFERELVSGAAFQREIPELAYDVTYALYHRKDTLLGRAALALMEALGEVAGERFADSIIPVED